MILTIKPEWVYERIVKLKDISSSSRDSRKDYDEFISNLINKTFPNGYASILDWDLYQYIESKLPISLGSNNKKRLEYCDKLISAIFLKGIRCQEFDPHMDDYGNPTEHLYYYLGNNYLYIERLIESAISTRLLIGLDRSGGHMLNLHDIQFEVDDEFLTDTVETRKYLLDKLEDNNS